MTNDSRTGPLSHLKVLDLSRMYPGAYCSLMLADLGADVLKVEGPGAGDGMRMMAGPGQFNAAHTALNRGKRSLVLDLRNTEASSVLKRLSRWADVAIESHKPGQLDKLGLGYEVMSKENPKLVWCSITGFGDFGPNKDMPGHDITYLGYSGLMSKLSEHSTTPPRTTISVPLAGLMSAIGILAAVTEANRTGKGSRLDANMTDSATWVLSEDIARSAKGPTQGWGSFVSRNVYKCADGREVTVASNEPKTWAVFCEGLNAPDLAGHQLGVDDDAKATARVAEIFLTKPAAHWCETPGLAGGVAAVNTPDDLVKDPQIAERGSLVPIDGSGHQVFANPIRFNSANGATASHALRDAPELGANTDEALRQAGFSNDEIASLREGKVIG